MDIYTYTNMYSSRSHESAERETETERDRERGYSNAPCLSLMALLQIPR